MQHLADRAHRPRPNLALDHRTERCQSLHRARAVEAGARRRRRPAKCHGDPPESSLRALALEIALGYLLRIPLSRFQPDNLSHKAPRTKQRRELFESIQESYGNPNQVGVRGRVLRR